MPICPKCHRWKRKKVLSLHKKNCIPTKTELEHYAKSKGGSMMKQNKT